MSSLRGTSQFKNKNVGSASVHKDECCKCFKDTFSPDGVFVCLVKLVAYCKDHVDAYAKKSGNYYFVNIKQKKILTQSKPAEVEKITKLAIGVEGGIDASKRFEIETEHKFVYLGPGESQIKPEEVEGLIKSILSCDSANKKADVQAWELQIHPCEHTLTLDQTGAKKIASKDLAHCGLCDLDNNLWICLVCGHLGCGRKFYDGTGGNGHALAHFDQTGHALAVKSGTISAEGQASIYCYACDNDVKDNDLPEHLSNLGIKVADMKKTEKTMTELNLQANLTLTLSNTYEKGKKLVPVFGKKKTGLENIGNSCYMASVLQCLANLPEVEQRYHQLAGAHMETCPNNPHECFMCQTCKLFSGLISGEYSIKQIQEIEVPSTGEKQVTEYQDGIKPHMFRHLYGKGHSEFSTHKQQDAMEYLIHLLSTLTKQEANSRLSPLPNLFEFVIETRVQCPNCPAMLISEISSKFLHLPVPLPKDFDTYGDSGKQEDMDYKATLDECLDMFMKGEKPLRTRCEHCHKEGNFTKTKYLKTFPKYLIIQLTNFAMNGWVPKKLHCDVDMGNLDMIKLEKLRAPKIKEGVPVSRPGEGMDGDEAPLTFDEEALANLLSMGFSENRCKRALMESGNNLENALNHIMSTMDDLSMDDPIVPKKKGVPGSGADSASIEKIVAQVWPTAESMGIRKKLVYAAAELRSNPEDVINYIFEHQAELEQSIEQKEKSASVLGHDKANFDNVQSADQTNFEAVGAVVHLGRSVHVGHYVAYAKHHDGWIYFNDSKVAKSEDPQVGKAYICFLKRKDSFP